MMRSACRLAIAAGLTLSAATLAQAAGVDLPNDELLCYQAKQTKILPKFVGVEISTKDQFEPLARRNYLAAKYVSVCNPQNPIVNSQVHYVGLSLKESKVNVNVTKYAPPTTVYSLADRIGMIMNPGVTISKPKELFVRVAKTRYGNALVKCGADPDCAANGTATECNLTGGICVNPGAPLPPAVTDTTNTADYMCYAIKGPKLTFPTQANLSDQFGFVQSYTPNKVTKVCAPTDKDMPNLAGPSPTFPGHLICYQAKSTKTNPAKFSSQVVAVSSSMINDYLEAKKVTDMCIPALKGLDPAQPVNGTPTSLITIGAPASGDCGNITTNMVGEGVPGRRSTSSPSTNPNAVCTGAGVPKTCCEAGVGVGHCDEGTDVVCGSLTFGGGGPSVGNPGDENPSAGGARSAYNLACANGSDPACVVSGDAGDIPNGINCTTTGCGGVTPVETTSPIKICAYNTLAAPGATGSLDLVTGAVSLSNTTNATVRIGTTTAFPTTACPRCRTTTATSSTAVFQTGTTPGAGVCDTDSSNSGAACFVFEGPGTAGLTTDCIPNPPLGTGVISIAVTTSTAGSALSHATGDLCPTQGQGGAVDCTGVGLPQPCCTGPGVGAGCVNYSGCFGSANAGGVKYADIPATCTGISTSGASSAMFTGFTMPGQNYGGTGCIPGVNSGSGLLDGLVNGNTGLPGPVVAANSASFQID